MACFGFIAIVQFKLAAPKIVVTKEIVAPKIELNANGCKTRRSFYRHSICYQLASNLPLECVLSPIEHVHFVLIILCSPANIFGSQLRASFMWLIKDVTTSI